jgi:ABC-type uncharacterized transport system ATPase subunit
MANVSLRHVSKRFGQINAVRDLSMAINDCGSSPGWSSPMRA